jgi:hypothetical protein
VALGVADGGLLQYSSREPLLEGWAVPDLGAPNWLAGPSIDDATVDRASDFEDDVPQIDVTAARIDLLDLMGIARRRDHERRHEVGAEDRLEASGLGRKVSEPVDLELGDWATGRIHHSAVHGGEAHHHQAHVGRARLGNDDALGREPIAVDRDVVGRSARTHEDEVPFCVGYSREPLAAGVASLVNDIRSHVYVGVVRGKRVDTLVPDRMTFGVDDVPADRRALLEAKDDVGSRRQDLGLGVEPTLAPLQVCFHQVPLAREAGELEAPGRARLHDLGRIGLGRNRRRDHARARDQSIVAIEHHAGDPRPRTQDDAQARRRWREIEEGGAMLRMTKLELERQHCELRLEGPVDPGPQLQEPLAIDLVPDPKLCTADRPTALVDDDPIGGRNVVDLQIDDLGSARLHHALAGVAPTPLPASGERPAIGLNLHSIVPRCV